MTKLKNTPAGEHTTSLRVILTTKFGNGPTGQSLLWGPERTIDFSMPSAGEGSHLCLNLSKREVETYPDKYATSLGFPDALSDASLIEAIFNLCNGSVSTI